MARQVVSKNDLTRMQTKAGGPGKDSSGPAISRADNFTDRLLKYIPAEIVAVYIFVQGLILGAQTPSDGYKTLFWIVFIVFAILTPFYLWRLLKVKKATQLIISLIAFIVWVFALGGPFATLDWYKPIYGEILLPIFTIVIAIVVAED